MCDDEAAKYFDTISIDLIIITNFIIKPETFPKTEKS